MKLLSILIALLLGLSPAFALADTGAVTTAVQANVSTPVATASVGAKADVSAAAMTRAKTHADQELTRRTTALNDLVSKVADIKNLSADNKTTIDASLTAQVNALAALKTKIDADTDGATLKTDVQSITGSYRIFALIVPQVRIITASDRVVTVAREMQLLSAKLHARVSAAQASGADMTAATAALNDFDAKVADAGTQAQAGVTAIAGLAPDQGNATQLAANTAALKTGRADVVTSQTDLKTARADAQTIVTAVKGKPVTAAANTSASAGASGTSGQ